MNHSNTLNAFHSRHTHDHNGQESDDDHDIFERAVIS